MSDLRMPGLIGFGFIGNIQLISPQIKILLMSAFEVDGDSEFDTQMKNGLIDGFIQKPVTLRELYGLSTRS